MNVVMMTNTYLPHVGGVARSVASFTEALRRRGHRVLVVAPTFDGAPEDEPGVVRVPAIRQFHGSDFSVMLPIPGLLTPALDAFAPDVIHSHHPFLLGVTALRVAANRGLPVVFTHHTMYEQYTHYLPGDSKVMRRFAVRLGADYCNLCDHVIAPSESVAEVLRGRGVGRPITAIPTGIDPRRFATGDGAAARSRYGIPAGAFVVGHVGRLAPEKNLGFLARAAARYLRADRQARFLVVGGGPAEAEVREACADQGVAGRLHLTGPLQGQELADAYHAMDVFAFASRSETQGMVLAEAMTAGVPVVALDAAGAREVVRDGHNGRLLWREDEADFADALRWVALQAGARRQALTRAALATAEEFSLDRCTDRLLAVYGRLVGGRQARAGEDGPLAQALRLLETEWQLWANRAEAAVKSFAASG